MYNNFIFLQNGKKLKMGEREREREDWSLTFFGFLSLKIQFLGDEIWYMHLSLFLLLLHTPKSHDKKLK